MARDLLGEAIDVLRRCSIDVMAGDLQEWDLRLPGPRIIRRRVHLAPGTITPRQTEKMKEGTLHVAERAAEDVLHGEHLPKTDLVVLDPPAAVIEGVLYRPEESDAVADARRGRGRPAKARWAIIRALLLSRDPLTQQAAASLAGTTQQAVSKTLHGLGSVVRVEAGWKAADAPKLLDEWEKNYPGPHGITTWWYGLQDPQTQARDAAKLADELEAEPLIGGDLAADEYAPWRLPSVAKVYVRNLIDLTPLGYSPAEPEDATLQVVVSDDKSLWRTAVERPGGRFVDPIIALWDLDHAAGPDANEAAAHLRERILKESAHDNA